MNIRTELLTAWIALTACLAYPSSASAQSLLKIDFGAGATTVQPGFTAVTGEVVQETHSETIGPYSVALSGNGFFGTGGNAGNVAESVRPLYRDYYYNNATGESDGVLLTLGGFQADTPYNVTLWSYDADQTVGVTPTRRRPAFDTSGPDGNIAMFATPYPTTLADFSTTISVTTATGTIDLFGSTIGDPDPPGGTRLNAVKVSSGTTDLLSLDFGRPDVPVSPVQATHIGISGDVAAPSFSQAVGAFTVSLAGGGFFQTTGENIDMVDAGVRDFYRDYYYNNATDPGVGVTLSIAGVTPNKDYDLKLWSYDADNFSPTPTVWTPQGATTGDVGNVINVRTPFPATLADSSTTIRVRSTTSTLTVLGSTTGGTGGTRLNGFELLAAGLAGDFNSSGTVNGVDLGLWRANFATGTTLATGDADGDNDADGADFLIWQRNLGAGSIVAVPEPGPSAMFVAAIVTLAGARRSRPSISRARRRAGR